MINCTNFCECAFASSAESEYCYQVRLIKKIADKLAVKKIIWCSTITIADVCVCGRWFLGLCVSFDDDK